MELGHVAEAFILSNWVRSTKSELFFVNIRGVSACSLEKEKSFKFKLCIHLTNVTYFNEVCRIRYTNTEI